MQTVSTIGLDIAKSVFQVHGVDAAGQGGHPPAVEAPPLLSLLPETANLPGGYRGVRFVAPLVPRTAGAGPLRSLDAAGLVKPYVKRQKNDAIDAEAICEAVTRPNMRFVPTKTGEQQSCLMLHRTRHLSFVSRPRSSIQSVPI